LLRNIQLLVYEVKNGPCAEPAPFLGIIGLKNQSTNILSDLP